MSSVVDAIIGLPPWLVLALVLALPAAEASLFVGLLVPGEIAVLIGGVVAHSGSLPLWSVVLAAAAGAALGDQAGYLLGRRYGPRLIDRLPARLRRSDDFTRAVDLVRRRGSAAVVLGRWAAALRALVPGVAGMSGMPRTAFTVANIIGGTAWAATVAIVGYLGAASYRSLEHRFSLAGEVVLGLVLVAAAAWLAKRRLARAREGRSS